MGFINSNFEILEKYFRRLSEYMNFANAIMVDPTAVEDPIAEIRQKYRALKIDIIMQELEGILSDSENGVSRVTEIISSLRLFARSVKDEEKDTCSLENIVNQVLLISNNEIKYVAKTEIEVPPDLILFCNKVQIGQVLINILVNAAQAIRDQGRDEMGLIKLTAVRKEKMIVITITDDGPGIPEENLLRIFDPFFTTKDIGQGTGLGLSISYDIIVNKHDGTIEVSSSKETGTTFVIQLPSI